MVGYSGMAYIKTKMIAATDMDVFEKDVNDFIEKHDGEILDIQYQYRPGMYGFSCMIVYDHMIDLE